MLTFIYLHCQAPPSTFCRGRYRNFVDWLIDIGVSHWINFISIYNKDSGAETFRLQPIINVDWNLAAGHRHSPLHSYRDTRQEVTRYLSFQIIGGRDFRESTGHPFLFRDLADVLPTSLWCRLWRLAGVCWDGSSALRPGHKSWRIR